MKFESVGSTRFCAFLTLAILLVFVCKSFMVAQLVRFLWCVEVSSKCYTLPKTIPAKYRSLCHRVVSPVSEFSPSSPVLNPIVCVEFKTTVCLKFDSERITRVQDFGF